MALKILIAEDQEEIREILTLMVESEFDHEIIEVDSGNKAIKMMESETDVTLVISGYKMKDGTGGDLYQFNIDNNGVPFILVSEDDYKNLNEFGNFLDKNPANSYLPAPFDHENLIDAISKALESSANDEKEKEMAVPFSSSSDYQRIAIHRYLKFSKAIGDTFVKISDDKFVKVFNYDDEVNLDQLQKYQQKNVKHLYIEKQQYLEFLNSTLKSLGEKLGQEDITSDELIGLQFDSIEQIQDFVLSLGVQKSVVELTDKVAESVNNSIKKENKLRPFLGQILKKENYSFELSNIINYLCGGITREMGWDTKRTMNKFITASTFCDIHIHEEPLLCSVVNLNGDRFKTLAAEDKKRVQEHIDQAIKILGQSDNATSDEINIIKEHHEKPDGSGFPRGINNGTIKPISAAFILAHDFARLLILSGESENVDPKRFLGELDRSYQSGNFEKVFVALQKALEKE